ncbi:glycosyl transferase family 2 [Planococcus donghaensis MPA1U2]|uniref:Glycosyl transferase family 2 n=1 Tax=Planococcus donghaensis MPA1U2 TaxID=933115 RepID=E7RDI3_9BACL|nr:glycosyltransferase [Planococcus donghaensis]EGA90987.1 glycosyl transferase family 2 [Planococcus donghaensis MPA1U2]
MGKDILVSVDCLAYNHEDFIAEAIESFLKQKTNFKFEILINDDASTDKTASIIKMYEEKYPDLIKPLYQERNLFSQSATMLQINQRRAKGKYIAICEGDDFWTDPYKLQKQVDYLEANLDCDLCVHSAYQYSEALNKVVGKVRPSRKSRDFSAEEVFLGGGELFPTNSMVYRREKADDVPDFYFDAGFGDYPLAIHLALYGKVHYLDEQMSVYRVDVKGAWSEKTLTTTINATKQNDATADLLDKINRHTNYQYDKTIEKTKKKNYFYLLIRQQKFKEVFTKEYARFYLELEFVRRIWRKVLKSHYYFKGKANHFLVKPRKKLA